MENAVPSPHAATATATLPARATGFAIERGTWVSRLTWSVLFALPTAVMITAAWLTPSPHGHGTHTQLGLPPCGFLLFTGYPCPGCGLTTAFSHMIRFEVVGAWMANPFGIALFLASAAFIPFSALGFVRGWGVVAALDRMHAEKVAIVLALLSVMTWVTRVAMQWMS